jgi:hypothetical protein
MATSSKTAAIQRLVVKGFGDSDKPAGTEGYDGRALAEEFRALRQQIGFGAGR